MLGSALSCGICEDLEEEEVVFIKSWIEELDATKEERTEQQEQKNKKFKDEKEDKEAKSEDFDDGQGDFVVVNRHRARSNRGAGGGGAAR